MQILKFSASWCNPCKVLTKKLEDLAVEVQNKDFDLDSECFTRYNITSVPTLVAVDAQGIEVSRFVGFKSVAELKAWINGVVSVVAAQVSVKH